MFGAIDVVVSLKAPSAFGALPLPEPFCPASTMPTAPSHAIPTTSSSTNTWFMRRILVSFPLLDINSLSARFAHRHDQMERHVTALPRHVLASASGACSQDAGVLLVMMLPT